MSRLQRVQYRAAIKERDGLEEALGDCERLLLAKRDSGDIYTAGMFRYGDMLFLYMEVLDGPGSLRPLADRWLTPILPKLKLWPEASGDMCFALMTPVFWFDVPKDFGSYARALPPEGRCGRIAMLRDDRVMSYVTHHQAIAAEGLLVGDRYQFISIHENILFSYFETPRDRERVNIRRAEDRSLELDRWLAADPDSHFCRFPEAPEENFMVIDTVFSM